MGGFGNGRHRSRPVAEETFRLDVRQNGRFLTGDLHIIPANPGITHTVYTHALDAGQPEAVALVPAVLLKKGA